ncbi:MAG TPA: CHC2 zinc finger domain-containing protein [Longimicrobiales bacterium]|nr:CHC2 zinc finger domain-containing protein [Longimicrobiales bacterium]
MMSAHLAAELAYAHRSGRSLPPGARVPGCGCELCTGLGDAPVAVPAPDFSRWEEAVERARAVPLLEVVHRLGLGEPRRHGRRWWIRCPFHEDRTPSLSLSPEKGLWHCFSCSEGGDALALLMRVRRVEFSAAVRELAA